VIARTLVQGGVDLSASSPSTRLDEAFLQLPRNQHLSMMDDG
jgi:hypothetical protein